MSLGDGYAMLRWLSHGNIVAGVKAGQCPEGTEAKALGPRALERLELELGVERFGLHRRKDVCGEVSPALQPERCCLMGFQPPPWASQPSRISTLEVGNLNIATCNRLASALLLQQR